jgi:dipeptidase E
MMINAVLYSDQVIPANAKVDLRLVGLMEGRGRRIGYVPSGPEPDLRFYKERRAYYARRGLDLDLFHDLDRPHGDAALTALFACDAIHLSGGDTAAFLSRLQRSGMLEKLRAWARAGGLLIGASAGAILMTPTIAVDALYGDGHPNTIEENDALALLPFEFFPHLQAKPRYLADLKEYSRRTPRPIIACPDGDGIVVADSIVDCIGDLLWIARGTAEPISHRRFPLAGTPK